MKAKRSAVRLVLFDIDGTLIRTGGAGVKAFERTFATVFNMPNATRELNFAGRTDPSLIREAFTSHQIEPTPEHFRQFYAAYVFWLDEQLQKLDGAPCPGVDEFIAGLKALHEPPVLGLLTGNIRLGAEIKLRHYNLWNPFITGAFGDDHEDRNELARIAKARGETLVGRKLTGEEILVIGDTPKDIACGQCIGARVLAVATGNYNAGALKKTNPTWAVDDLSKISATEACE